MNSLVYPYQWLVYMVCRVLSHIDEKITSSGWVATIVILTHKASKKNIPSSIESEVFASEKIRRYDLKLLKIN